MNLNEIRFYPTPNISNNQFPMEGYHGDPNFEFRPPNQDQEEERNIPVRVKRRREHYIEELSPENQEIVESLRTQDSCRNDRLCRLISDKICTPTSFLTVSPFTICAIEIMSLSMRHNWYPSSIETDQSDFARYSRYVRGRFFFMNGLIANRAVLSRPYTYTEQEGLMSAARPSVFRRNNERRSRRNIEYIRLMRYRQNFLSSTSSRRRMLSSETDSRLDLSRRGRHSSRLDGPRYLREIRDRSGFRSRKRRRINEPEEDFSIQMQAASISDDSDKSLPENTISDIVVLGETTDNIPDIKATTERALATNEVEIQALIFEKQDSSSQTESINVPDEVLSDEASYEDACNYYLNTLRNEKIKLDDGEISNEDGSSSCGLPLGLNNETNVSKRNKNRFSLISENTAGNYFYTYGEPPFFRF